MNRQIKIKFYKSATKFYEFFAVINDAGQIDQETISSKELSQEEVDNATFEQYNNGIVEYNLVEVDGVLGLYDYNLNCIEEYDSMQQFKQIVWGRGFGISVFTRCENDSVLNNLEFDLYG